MKVIYRIADVGYKKVKPDYISNEKCLSNFVWTFQDHDILVMADNISDKTRGMIQQHEVPIEHVSVGHGAGTFNLALDIALTYDDDEIVYFVENDYIHKVNSYEALKDGFNLGFDYITLYDHPDKYMLPKDGGNKFCIDGGEETRVYYSKLNHWRLTNSTTFTFAARVDKLKKDYDIFHKYTNGHHPETGVFTGHPYDFSMWLDLRANNRTLASPVPGYSTHGETKWLSPSIDWEQEISNN